MKHWQTGLDSDVHVSGGSGMIGAKMKLNYTFGKRKMTLTKTITHRDNKALHFNFNFDSKNLHNMQESYFEAIDANTTQWVSKNQFASTNFGMRMMLMPKEFKKQSKRYLLDLKNFAENGTSLLK